MPDIAKLIESTTRSDGALLPLSPQSRERNAVATKVYSIFERKRAMRDRRQELFRDRTLLQYIEANVKRFIQFKRRPVWKKNWQSNLSSSTPNEKLIGVLSRLATRGMEVKVSSLGEPTIQEMLREKISNALLKKSAIKNEDDFQIILEMMEAAEKGTVIGLEDWYHGQTTIREVSEQNPETGELIFTEKTIKRWNDVRSSIVNLEDFYPGDVYVRPGKVQDMDDCFIRTKMTEDEFDEQFGNYPDADYVRTVDTIINESTPFWKQSLDVGNKQVEVLRYFNKMTDEYVILANGIWINSIGKATVQPLPWNHKRLPIWAAVFEPLDSNFFYGRAMADKYIAFTDAKDALFDRMLDQMTLIVSRPIITDGSAASALTKGFLQPNNVIQTDWSNGKPNFEVVPIPDLPTTSVTLYQLLQQNLEQVGVAAETIGGRGVKTKTATQVNVEQEGAMQIISLFLTLMEHGIKDKARLRFPNILQFYSMPIHDEDELSDKFRSIVLKNESLSTGEVGDLHINITNQPDLNRVISKKQKTFKTVEFVEISPEFLRNFEWEVEIVPQSSIKMTDNQKQVLELNFQRLMLEMYPEKFNRDTGFEELARTFNKDPNKVKVEIGDRPPEQLMPESQQVPLSRQFSPRIGSVAPQIPSIV